MEYGIEIVLLFKQISQRLHDIFFLRITGWPQNKAAVLKVCKDKIL